MRYTAYTDGSFQSSINAGGYAVVILDESDTIVAKLYQGFKGTTNNRMEIRGVLEALKYFNKPTDITIVSDSQYVVNTIQKGYAQK